MFKYTVVIFAIIACAAAKPGILGSHVYSAPLIAAPGVVTATSSQVVARNYNGIAAPVLAAAPVAVASPLAAPLAAHLAARYVTSPLAAPLAARYVASPLAYSASLAAAPVGYASAYGYSASAPLLW